MIGRGGAGVCSHSQSPDPCRVPPQSGTCASTGGRTRWAGAAAGSRTRSGQRCQVRSRPPPSSAARRGEVRMLVSAARPVRCGCWCPPPAGRGSSCTVPVVTGVPASITVATLAIVVVCCITVATLAIVAVCCITVTMEAVCCRGCWLNPRRVFFGDAIFGVVYVNNRRCFR